MKNILFLFSISLVLLAERQPVHGECTTNKKLVDTDFKRDIFGEYSFVDIYQFGIKCRNLSSLQPETLSILSTTENIGKIEIIDSNLSVLPAGIFEAFPTIEKLSFNNSLINQIEPLALSNLTNLTELHLAHNSLHEIKEDVLKNTNNLTTLDLSYNNFTSMDSLLHISSLEELFLKHNRLTSLTFVDVKSFPELSILDLTNNYITALSPTLFQNHSIGLRMHLDLAYNKIKSIPDALFDEPNAFLRLNVSNNQISTIKCASHQNSTNEKYDPDLTRFIHLFSEMADTFSMDFSSNKLTCVPPSLYKIFKFLRVLNISDNALSDIHVDSFVGLFSLYELYLNKNQIEKLEIGTFRELDLLQYLDLSSNNLAHLEHGTFSGPSELQTLDLSYNKFTSFDFTPLYPVSSLLQLYLNGNMLDTISTTKLFSHFKKLRLIGLEFSLISCDDLMMYIAVFKEHEVKVRKGTEFKKHNIDGMACNGTLNNTKFLNDSPSTTVKSYTTTTAPTAIKEVTYADSRTTENKSVNAERIATIDLKLNEALNANSGLKTLLIIITIIIIIYATVKIMLTYRRYQMRRRRNNGETQSGLELLNETL